MKTYDDLNTMPPVFRKHILSELEESDSESQLEELIGGCAYLIEEVSDLNYIVVSHGYEGNLPYEWVDVLQDFIALYFVVHDGGGPLYYVPKPLVTPEFNTLLGDI